MKPLLVLVAASTLIAANGPGEGWRLRLPVTPAPGGKLQRVELPAAAILALQRSDGGDVRVFDASGRAQPLARLPTPAAPPRRIALTPLPILGASDALKVTGVTLRVDDGQARVVRVDGQPAGATGGQEVLGVLLDTRGTDAPVQELTLDVDAPANQPVTFTIESSSDLQTWTPEGEKVLFRAGAGVPFAVPLHDERLRGRMLRVTWRAQTRLLSPVAVKGAALVLAGSADAARVAVRATLPPLGDKRVAEFVLPLAVAPEAIRVATAVGTAPLSVEIAGRENREQPWVVAGSGIAAPNDASPAIEVAGRYREWQVKAGPNGDGFDAAPKIELRFAPIAVAFLAAGQAPYTLAIGRAEAGPGFTPLGTLEQMAGEQMTGGEAAMATASVAASAPAPLALAAVESGVSRRSWLLWGMLALGVVVLGGMAAALLRGNGMARRVSE